MRWTIQYPALTELVPYALPVDIVLHAKEILDEAGSIDALVQISLISRHVSPSGIYGCTNVRCSLEW
jgi:hypothetical protein